MTQLSEAKRGRITPEMRKAAQKEGISERILGEKIARGEVVLPKNVVHNLFFPKAIGKGMKTKVNTNIGTSPDLADINLELKKLKVAETNGADAILNVKELDIRSIKKKVREIATELGASPYLWKIFEMSGTKAGQELGFILLTFASTLSIVGFTLDKLEVRLSNLMAFDSQLIGTWGCKPELYPEVLNLVATDKIKIDQFVQTFPMSRINEVFHNTLQHKYIKRSILVPDFD